MTLAAELRRAYHLADVGPEHLLRRAADELERLEADVEEKRRLIADAAEHLELGKGMFANLADTLVGVAELTLEIGSAIPELAGSGQQAQLAELIERVRDLARTLRPAANEPAEVPT